MFKPEKGTKCIENGIRIDNRGYVYDWRVLLTAQLCLKIHCVSNPESLLSCRGYDTL